MAALRGRQLGAHEDRRAPTWSAPAVSHTDAHTTYRRQLAYGVYEGMHGTKGEQILWGGGMYADLEIADAEMYAIYAYMWKVAQRVGFEQLHTVRMLIQSNPIACQHSTP